MLDQVQFPSNFTFYQNTSIIISFTANIAVLIVGRWKTYSELNNYVYSNA